MFVALFLYSLIDNMPKFVMEGVLSYDNQLYYNVLYFPAMGILLTAQLIYKPMLVKMAAVWADPEKRKRFDMIIVVIVAVIVGITVVMALIMGWIGITIMSFLYGVDFEQFRGLVFIMLAAGGVTACIDFLYQVVTVLRQQRTVTKLYLITFGFSLFVPILLVNFTGLPGAIIGYLIVMCILLVLLVWEYGKVRMALAERDKQAAGASCRRKMLLPSVRALRRALPPQVSGGVLRAMGKALLARGKAVRVSVGAPRASVVPAALPPSRVLRATSPSCRRPPHTGKRRAGRPNALCAPTSGSRLSCTPRRLPARRQAGPASSSLARESTAGEFLRKRRYFAAASCASCSGVSIISNNTIVVPVREGAYSPWLTTMTSRHARSTSIFWCLVTRLLRAFRRRSA